MKHLFYSKVEQGKLNKHSAKSIAECLNSFEGIDVCISIEKKKKQRSNLQNAYYWSCVIPLIKETLYELGNEFSTEQVHDLLKYQFLKEIIPYGEDGQFIERIKSTTELSTFEFMAFKESIQRWAAEMFDLQIPDPKEQLEFNL